MGEWVNEDELEFRVESLRVEFFDLFRLTRDRRRWPRDDRVLNAGCGEVLSVGGLSFE